MFSRTWPRENAVVEAFEPVPPHDSRSGQGGQSPLGRDGWTPAQRPVGALAVVVLSEDPHHLLEMTASEDQQPVKALRTRRPHEALGVSIRSRCPVRREDDGCAVAAKDLAKVPVKCTCRLETSISNGT